MKRYGKALLAAAGLIITMNGAIAASLAISVAPLRNSNGQLAVAVFVSGEGFPGKDSKAVRRVQVPIQPGSEAVQTVISDLPTGRYAVAVFHDDDNSGKLETSLFGIPRKGYGFSNNVVPPLRSASFDEAAFELPESGASITIRLVYRN